MVILQLNWNLHDERRLFLYAHDDLQWLIHGGRRILWSAAMAC